MIKQIQTDKLKARKENIVILESLKKHLFLVAYHIFMVL